MKGGEFDFDQVNELHQRCNKISLKRGGIYIESPKWTNDEKKLITHQTVMVNVFSMR